MINRYLLLFLLFISALATCGQALTPEQLRADFARFQTALSEVHPAPYRYTPKDRFDSLVSATAAQLNRPMTQHEFYVAMTPLLVALRDGHIKWLIPGQEEHYPFFTDKLFPLKLYFLGDKAWVMGSYGADTIPAGAQIVAINNLHTATIIEKLLPKMTFSDGATLNGKYEDLTHFFSGYYATFLGAPAVYQIMYQVGHVRKTIKLPAVSYAAIKQYEEQHKRSQQPSYRVTFDESTQTAVMTIERFWREKNEPEFDVFLTEAFCKIKEKNVQHLVLDLRNNEGGEEKYGVSLYQYVAQKPFRYYDHISVRQKRAYSFPVWTSKLYQMVRWFVVKKRDDGYVFTKQRGLKTLSPRLNAFAGKLYVLINGGSFSVTTEFAARVHADGRGTFIGQETGGAYEGNNSGLFAITQLLHSKIDLGIPMFGFYMTDLPRDLQQGQGIRPDHLVTPTIQDVLTGHDPAMEYTWQLIRSAELLPPKTAATNE